MKAFLTVLFLFCLAMTSFGQSTHHKPDTAKENADSRKQIAEKYKSEIRRMETEMKRIQAQVKRDSLKTVKQPAKPKDQ